MAKKLGALDEYLSWLRQAYRPELVILFGSLARGDWTESSDIDLLIASHALGPSAWENYARLKKPGIEPLGFSPEALLEEVRRPSLVVLDALQYGKVLLADESYRYRLMKAFEEVKEKFSLRWRDGTWTWKAPLSNRVKAHKSC